MLPVTTMLASHGTRSVYSGGLVPRQPAHDVVPYTHRASHIDGDYAGPTRPQARCRCSAVLSAIWEAQLRAQGAPRRPERESIDLYNRSIDCARCEETRVCGGRGAN